MWKNILLMTLCFFSDLGLLYCLWCILYEFLEGSTKLHKKFFNQAPKKEKIKMGFIEQYVVEKKNEREVLCFKRYHFFYLIALITIPIKYVVTIVLAVCGSFKVAKCICLYTTILLVLIGTHEWNRSRITPHTDRNYRKK